MRHFSDISGIIGKSFQFGYGKDSIVFELKADEKGNLYLTIPAIVDAGGHAIRSSAKPVTDSDVINLTFLQKQLKEALRTAETYTDLKIKDITGGTTGGNVMLVPTTITIDNIVDGYSIPLGSLEPNKFVDRIIFEVVESFNKASGDLFDVSIGTVLDPEAYVPKFSIENLTKTYIVNVCKTLVNAADFVLYVSTHVEPDPIPDFTQEIINNHEGVVTSMTCDASGKIWNMSFDGEYIEREILDEDTFGNVEGIAMDFAVTIPVEPNHRYRIVQRNPALAFYEGKDGYVNNTDGVWTKDKNYTTGDAEESMAYQFLMMNSNGDNDYVHIWLYDLESATPGDAIRTYHIKNGLHFEGTSELMSPIQYNFYGANEGTCGLVKNADNEYTFILSGTIHGMDNASEVFPNVTVPMTMLGIYYPKSIPVEGIRIAIYNPLYAQLPPDEYIHSSNGVYYTDMTVTQDDDMTEGIWINIPIIQDSTYPITLSVVDLATNDVMLVGIDNNLVIESPIPEEEPPVETAAVMPMAFALDTENVSEIETGVDSGKMVVRVLSF